MLEQEDRRWIQETIKTGLIEQEERLDTKLETRLAEQEERFDAKLAKQSKEIYEAMDERFAKQNEEFNKMIDERFAEQNRQLNMTIDIRHNDILKKIDDRFNEMKADNDKQLSRMMKIMDQRFNEQDRHIDSVFENTIMPKLELFMETIPGFNQSYEKLEKRVTKLEREQDVLKAAIKSNM